MRKIFLILFSATVFISCRKDNGPEIIRPLDDNSKPSGAITSLSVVTKTSSYVDFEVGVAVFRDSKNMENQLSSINFLNDTLSISGIPHYITLRDLVVVNNTNSTPYSAIMLMDQSGSISLTDPYDRRLDAASAFVRKLGAGDNISLWSFQGSTYKQISTSFNSDSTTLLKQIEALRNQETGGTPLYLSQNQVTNYIASNGPNANKAVLTFTDGEDNASGSTTSTIVTNNATAKGIKLFNIGLGNASMEVLQKQALATNGAFMFAEDAPQLISMFGNLGKLLSNTAVYYKTTWRLTKNSGTFGTGSYSLSIKVNLPYGGTIEIPYIINY